MFDNRKLQRISGAICGGSNQLSRTVYQCTKFNVWYDLPLGEKSIEKDCGVCISLLIHH